MDVSIAGVTVNAVEPDTLPDIAVIVLIPTATDEAKPFDPTALLIAAIPESDELQVTEAAERGF